MKMQFTDKKGFIKAFTNANPPPPPPSVRSTQPIATTRAAPLPKGGIGMMNFKNLNEKKPSCRSCGH